MVFSLLRFTLPSSSAASASAFLKLRQFVSLNGKVETQYFGYVTPVMAPPRKPTDEMCWVIEWPNGADLRSSPSFRAELHEVTQGRDTKSLLLEFNDSKLTELRKAFESPVTEFAIINLVPTAPLSNPDFKHSMHKTYTDCYFAEGFTGGNWEYAVNTNNTDELLKDPTEEQVIKEGERRLACYPLGWESIEHHHAYSRSALFDEEIDKLKGWFGPGTGAWYATLKKHT